MQVYKPKNYTECPHCDSAFAKTDSGRAALRQHLAKAHPPGSIRPVYVNTHRFPYDLLVWRGGNRVSDVPKALVCPYCPSGFVNSEIGRCAREVHIAEHEGREPLCRNCLKERQQ